MGGGVISYRSDSKQHQLLLIPSQGTFQHNWQVHILQNHHHLSEMV